MKTSEDKNTEENEEFDDDRSLKNAMLTSILFVGGGLVFFWILLFVIFTIRG